MTETEIISMEDVLIEQVRRRPSIYDKTSAVYKNGKIRDQEWKEVAKAVNMKDVEAVKKRWRSLRDSFIKIQRSLKHNPKQGIKWLYYKRLLFLLPHIESKEQGSDILCKPDDDDGVIQDAAATDNEIENGPDCRFLSDDVTFSDTSQHSQVRTDCSNFCKKRKRDKTNFDEDPLMTNEHMFDYYLKRRSKNGVDDDASLPPFKETDADEHFLLSCLPALKRLAPRENALAKMKIQQVLFDVEFGESQQSSGVLISKMETIDEDG